MPATKKKTPSLAARKSIPKSKPAPKAKAKTASQKKASAVRSSPEETLAASALKWIDEAASLLRTGVHKTASTTANARIDSKQKAHALLTKAHGNLSKALSEGTSLLHGALKKLP